MMFEPDPSGWSPLRKLIAAYDESRGYTRAEWKRGEVATQLRQEEEYRHTMNVQLSRAAAAGDLRFRATPSDALGKQLGPRLDIPEAHFTPIKAFVEDR